MRHSVWELYLKSHCQADGYQIVIQNDERQERHAKVLSSFTCEENFTTILAFLKSKNINWW